MRSQGYITIATGHPRYLEMARNFAASVRRFDPGRPVCLVHDDGAALTADDRVYFDHFVRLPPDTRYVGCANKLRLYGLSPFDETMYVDADCLLLSADIDLYWRALHGFDFTVAGDVRRDGFWNDLDIAGVCARFGLPYIVQMNSGVLFFRKSPQAERVFATANHIYLHHRDEVSYIHKGASGQYADEPIFAVAMGTLGLVPLPRVCDRSWMVTTWRAGGFRYDPATGRFSLRKFNRFLLGRIPLGWVTHTPVVVHFIGLRPRRLYRRLAATLRRDALAASAVPAHAS